MYNDCAETYKQFEDLCWTYDERRKSAVAAAQEALTDLTEMLGVEVNVNSLHDRVLRLRQYVNVGVVYTQGDTIRAVYVKVVFEHESRRYGRRVQVRESVCLRDLPFNDVKGAWKLYSLITKLPAANAAIMPTGLLSPNPLYDDLDDDEYNLSVKWRYPDEMSDVTDED